MCFLSWEYECNVHCIATNWTTHFPLQPDNSWSIIFYEFLLPFCLSNIISANYFMRDKYNNQLLTVRQLWCHVLPLLVICFTEHHNPWCERRMLAADVKCEPVCIFFSNIVLKFIVLESRTITGNPRTSVVKRFW